MYRLLLVSDRDDVMEAYEQVHNWGFNGFNKPHLRHDLDGAKEALKKHHIDGIGMALEDAVRRAKDYISGALAAMLDMGRGSGPMDHMFDLNSGFIGEVQP